MGAHGGQLRMGFADDLKTLGRVLTFRDRPGELQDLSWRLLWLGLGCTWLVGIGRWWDDPRPEIPLLARAGLGSVIYVFALSFLLWVFTRPFARHKTSYRQMLAFVACTSPPAILYAIPVEKWLPFGPASLYNLAALLIVATYRVCLLIHYLRRGPRLLPKEVFLVAATPIMLILLGLAAAGMAARIVDIMGGFRESIPQESAEMIVFLIAGCGFYLTPFLLLAYIISAVVAVRRRRAIRVPVKLQDDRISWMSDKGVVEINVEQILDIYAVHVQEEYLLQIITSSGASHPLFSDTTNFWTVAAELEARLHIRNGSIREAGERSEKTSTNLYSSTPSVFLSDPPDKD